MKLHMMNHLGEVLITCIMTLCICVIILSKDDSDDNENNEDSE
jgi:hypothetical protein